MPNSHPNLLSVTQAALSLGIGKTLLYKLMDQGKLRYIKLGRARRIDVTDLNSLVATSRVGTYDGP